MLFGSTFLRIRSVSETYHLTYRMLMPVQKGTSDHEVNQILSLVDAAQAPVSAVNITEFYVRTFAFAKHELMLVIRDLIDSGYGFSDVIRRWIPNVYYSADDQTIFIRYCGQTDAGVMHRHYHDLSLLTNQSFQAWFFQTMARLTPHVLFAARVQSVKSADIVSAASNEVKDMHEKVLIALFGVSASNVDVGGGSFTFNPSQEDRNACASLPMATFELLRSSLTPCDPARKAQILKYVRAAQNYANEHPATTGTGLNPVTDHLAQLILDSAIPSYTDNGFCPIVILGSDITVELSQTPSKPFLAVDPLKSRASSTYIASAANWLESWEMERSRPVDSAFKTLVDQNCFPFVDVYPWPGKDESDLAVCTWLLRRYLDLAWPIVLLSLGQKPSSVALSNIWNDNGLPYSVRSLSGKFIQDWVAVPAIRFSTPYHARDASEYDPDDDAILVIACLHPGFIEHCAAREEAARLLLLTLAVALFAVSEALKLGNNPELTRLEICQLIRDQVIDCTDPSTTFGRALADAKRDLLAGLQRRASNSKELAERRKAKTAEAKALSGYSAGAEKFRKSAAGLSGRSRVRKLGAAFTLTGAENKRQSMFFGSAPVGTEYSWKDENVDPIHFTLHHTKHDVFIASPVARWKAARSELDTITHSGRVKGTPRSSQRLNNANAVYKLAAGPYRAQAAEAKKAFIKWANNEAKVNESWYMSRSTWKDAAVDLEQLLRCFLLKTSDFNGDPDDPVIMEDEHALESAFIELEKFVTGLVTIQDIDAVNRAWFDFMKEVDVETWLFLRKPHVSNEVTVIHKFEGPIDATLVQLKAAEKAPGVGRFKDGFQWIDESGDQHRIDCITFPKGVLPESPHEQRFLFL